VRAAAELARIRGQLERIGALCGTSETRLLTANERVSRWSAAQHLDHLMKVTASVLHRLPSTEAIPRGISLLGRTILALRWIPRGRGRAPERLVGKHTTPAELQAALAKVTASLAAVDPSTVDAARIRNVPHPYFGGLTPAEALRFVTVHNEHHLKIVGDILR
jgi:hypothetical protein